MSNCGLMLPKRRKEALLKCREIQVTRLRRKNLRLKRSQKSLLSTTLIHVLIIGHEHCLPTSNTCGNQVVTPYQQRSPSGQTNVFILWINYINTSGRCPTKASYTCQLRQHTRPMKRPEMLAFIRLNQMSLPT